MSVKVRLKEAFNGFQKGEVLTTILLRGRLFVEVEGQRFCRLPLSFSQVDFLD